MIDRRCVVGIVASATVKPIVDAATGAIAPAGL
jgi:hypothetical protein